MFNFTSTPLMPDTTPASKKLERFLSKKKELAASLNNNISNNSQSDIKSVLAYKEILAIFDTFELAFRSYLSVQAQDEGRNLLQKTIQNEFNSAIGKYLDILKKFPLPHTSRECFESLFSEMFELLSQEKVVSSTSEAYIVGLAIESKLLDDRDRYNESKSPERKNRNYINDIRTFIKMIDDAQAQLLEAGFSNLILLLKKTTLESKTQQEVQTLVSSYNKIMDSFLKNYSRLSLKFSDDMAEPNLAECKRKLDKLQRSFRAVDNAIGQYGGTIDRTKLNLIKSINTAPEKSNLPAKSTTLENSSKGWLFLKGLVTSLISLVLMGKNKSQPSGTATIFKDTVSDTGGNASNMLKI